MYVIATVICPNFHFSVSPHVPFLNLLFEQIANSNEYFTCKNRRRYSREQASQSLEENSIHYSFASLVATVHTVTLRLAPGLKSISSGIPLS